MSKKDGRNARPMLLHKVHGGITVRRFMSKLILVLLLVADPVVSGFAYQHCHRVKVNTELQCLPVGGETADGYIVLIFNHRLQMCWCRVLEVQ